MNTHTTPDTETTVPPCARCSHPADEHSVYGCFDDCGCPDRPDLPAKVEPIVQATAYLVSLLPEGHDDRYLFTVQVKYQGGGRWAVTNRSRSLGSDGEWSWGFSWSEGPDEPATEAEMASFDAEQAVWLAAHRFDEETALRAAKEACRKLSYRGWSAEDAAAGRPFPAAVSGVR